jgi:glycosyltransferase involved in cell wall biosynthesis
LSTPETVETQSNEAGQREEPDLVCLSHLRWDFVYQRPQHLLSRCARERRVFFVEEPIYDEGPLRLEVGPRAENLWVATPHLPHGLAHTEAEAAQQQLLDALLAEKQVGQFILWYYTPMALGFSSHLQPSAVVYDCMDELSAFRGAPATLRQREAELFRRADVVFTGGLSLYEVKRKQHANVHAFPSSIDVNHFGRARAELQEPADQAPIPRPRLGFFGVIDERLDIELLNSVAAARPDWHLILVGPVVKIDEAILPRRPNLHYLGMKPYEELPAYLAGWDVALLPFARNEATRFISPTKTPEYLAGGKPVVSTPIHDVVCPYGEQNLVQIASGAGEFITAVTVALDSGAPTAWRQRVDAFLAQNSWDYTWQEMRSLIQEAVAGNRTATSVGQVPITDTV